MARPVESQCRCGESAGITEVTARAVPQASPEMVAECKELQVRQIRRDQGRRFAAMEAEVLPMLADLRERKEASRRSPSAEAFAFPSEADDIAHTPPEGCPYCHAPGPCPCFPNAA